MIETKISCDSCSTELKAYYFSLEEHCSWGAMIPQLGEYTNYHFCGLSCLKKFLENKQ